MTYEVTVRAESAAEFRAKVGELFTTMFGGAAAPLPEAEDPQPKATRAGRSTKAAEAKAPEPEQPAAPTLTMDDLRSAMSKFIETDPRAAQASIEIIKELNAFNEEGLPKLAAVKPEDFAKCLDLIEKKTAEFKAAPAGVL